MSHAKAKVRLRAVRLRDNLGHESMVVEIEIDCDACGGTEGAIHGHHLRTLHAAFGKLIEMQPELCGEVGVVADVLQFSGSLDQAKKASSN